MPQKEEKEEVVQEEKVVEEEEVEQEGELPEGFFENPEEDRAARKALGADEESEDENEEGEKEEEDDVDRMLRGVAETVKREEGNKETAEEEEEGDDGSEEEESEEEEGEEESAKKEAEEEAEHAAALGREVASVVDVRAAWGMSAGTTGSGAQDEDDSDAAVFGDDDLAWNTRQGHQ